MAASSRQDTNAGETGADSCRNETEKTGTEKYHPRSILFSGPPQVKTAQFLIIPFILIWPEKTDIFK